MKQTLAKILNYAPLLGVLLAIVLAVFIFSGRADADNTIGDLISQKSMLALRIEQAQAEYSNIAQEKQDAQESCNIAVQKAEQLKQLAELNGARRAEVKAIDQKISTLTGNLSQHQ